MVSDNKIPLIAIVGPTASGKTALSIEIAKHFNGEIVSADSMQIYKGMDIATAKPSIDELQSVPHHMIGFLDNDKSFSVAQYCDMAHCVIQKIHNKGKIPVVVGGTGLYIDSLLNNTVFSHSDCDENLRDELQRQAAEKGVDSLLEMLQVFDPDMALKLSAERNLKRIIRAIEVYKVTGITMTEHNIRSHDIESPYKAIKIGLTATDRQFLYDRINTRVDIMIENGLLEEARDSLSEEFSNTSSMAIGHKELLPYFAGESDLQSCVEKLKMQTRRYAKRQLTWFNRDEQIHWFNIDVISKDELVTEAIDLVKKVLFNEEK